MLYLVATPIGNLEDITLRALRCLREVDFVLAEDTRKTGILLKHFGVTQPLHSFHEHSELKKIARVIRELKKGRQAALVSSAGVPTISDPGYKLVRACRQESIAVTSVPGASSLINALALSVAPRDKFAFLGYFPRKKNERRRLLERVQAWGLSLVFFESPYRLLKTLKDIELVLGQRPLTIAREMTKKFEEVLELTAPEALVYFSQHKPKGEFTVVIYRQKEEAELKKEGWLP